MDTPRSRHSGTAGPHTWETSGPPPEPEPKIEEPEEEGLSLRERLARAAAGRKRLS